MYYNKRNLLDNNSQMANTTHYNIWLAITLNWPTFFSKTITILPLFCSALFFLAHSRSLAFFSHPLIWNSDSLSLILLYLAAAVTKGNNKTLQAILQLWAQELEELHFVTNYINLWLHMNCTVLIFNTVIKTYSLSRFRT